MSKLRGISGGPNSDSPRWHYFFAAEEDRPTGLAPGLFWNGKNWLGWLLTVGGALFILAGIIANMHIYFHPTSLFETMIMLILFVGGLVLIVAPCDRRT